MIGYRQRVEWLIRTGQLPELSAEQLALIDRLEQSGVLEDVASADRVVRSKEDAAATWLRTPPTPMQFLTDPYYAGEYAAYRRGLYPKLREDFCKVFDGEIPVTEVCFSGSIGNGKSFFIGWCMAYQLCLLSCLRDPHLYCGIERGTPIVLLNLSVTGAQAKGSIFHYVKMIVDASPYFRDNFTRDRRVQSQLVFPNEIYYQSGSSSAFSAIGRNVIAGAIDEANFLVSSSRKAHEKAAGEAQHAMHLYLELSDRVISRFLFSGPGFRGRVFMASSSLFADDFMSAHVRKNEFRRWPEGDLYVMNYAHWEVRDPADYSGETFRVVVGSATTPPMLLPDDAPTPSDAEVVVVPAIYRTRFRSDVHTALRNIAGRVTFGLNLFLDPRWVDSALQDTDFFGVDLRMPEGISDASGVVLEREVIAAVVDYLTFEFPVFENGRRVLLRRPRRDPSAPRFIHFDQSVSEDAAGVAMSYVAGHREIEGIGRLPLIVTELALNVVAPAGGQIRLEAFRELCYALQGAGYRLGVVSFDSYQSVDSIQILQAHGFNVEPVSVDRDMAAYDVLRGALRDGRWRAPRHPVLSRELRKLERVISKSKKMKIDHPLVDLGNPRGEKGSKDVADAVAGSLSTLMAKQDLGGPFSPAASVARPVAPRGGQWANPMDNWILPEHLRPSDDGG